MALIGLDGDGSKWLPATGGRLHIRGEGVPRQCGHNDFRVDPRPSDGYFAILIGVENNALYVCPAFHKLVFGSVQARATLCKTLGIEELTIPP